MSPRAPHLQVSKAATGLCMWVHAIDVYCRTGSDVKPKRDKLQALDASLQEAHELIEGKHAELKVVLASS